MRPVYMDDSLWDTILDRRRDGPLARHLGFRQIRGLRHEDADGIVAARANGYPDVESVRRSASVRCGRPNPCHCSGPMARAGSDRPASFRR